MNLPPLVLLAAHFSLVVYATVLDVGDINQYAPKLTSTPDGIQPNAIWIKPADDGGFHIVLSADIQAKIVWVLKDSCSEVNDKCYQDLHAAVQYGVVVLDHHLESRQIEIAAASLIESFGGVEAVLNGIAVLELALLAAQKQMISELGFYMPMTRAKYNGGIPQGSVTILAGATTVATITQGPTAQPTLEGSVTPIVTAVTVDANDGFYPGDLAAFLDPDLATRLSIFMQGATACTAGEDFDYDNPPTKKKRAAQAGTYGQALCASFAVIGGITPDGPWNDLLLLDPKGVQFGISREDPTASAAAIEFSHFVESYAPLIGIPPDRVNQLDSFIFALAVDVVMAGVILEEKNRIPASLVTLSLPSPTVAGCPDKKSLICGLPEAQDCDMAIAEQNGGKMAVCKDGPYKNCECTGPAFMSIETHNLDRQLALRLFVELFINDPPPPQLPNPASCPRVVTELPAEVFSSKNNPDMNIHHRFCDGWFKDNKKFMTVDSKGANVLPEPHLKDVPPKFRRQVNADMYSDYRFELSYRPWGNDESCSMNCDAAFAQIASSCSDAAEDPNIYMYANGTYDIACGIFTYKVLPPASLIEYPLVCHKWDYSSIYTPLNTTDVPALAQSACANGSVNLIKGWDETTFIHKTFHMFYTSDVGTLRDYDAPWVPFQFNIWWKSGCVHENGGPIMLNYSFPLGDEVGLPSCEGIFLMLSEVCQGFDEKVGGHLRVGCLVYEVRSSNVVRAWGYSGIS
ncbi:hypothetical protein QBC34DRAFT_467713 [Podospora aff. communis PSN243]|uniref:Uncharacterized protein n=1 Tax=Podospora aff. communis PSN243 TaxID=3040156 RepID=A0AAV9GH01_9PEZI|nr:hypothetical protein QBC34DRAFT_467713 [Podospora aff. communis PSN243]